MASLESPVSMVALQAYPSGIHTCRNYNVRIEMRELQFSLTGHHTSQDILLGYSRVITYAAST